MEFGLDWVYNHGHKRDLKTAMRWKRTVRRRARRKNRKRQLSASASALSQTVE